MGRFDITETNAAVERLLEVTDNPRHRYLLEAYNRHRYLEMAGRYSEIFAPDMTVEHPIYRFDFIGQPRMTLDGREQVEAIYHEWTETDQCIFYVENERLAVGDDMIISRSILYQQVLGSALAELGLDVDVDAMYLNKSNIAMIWPYDERGRMIGEDVWEYDETGKDLIKLAPGDVLTAHHAAELLDSFIRPLPPFPEPVPSPS